MATAAGSSGAEKCMELEKRCSEVAGNIKYNIRPKSIMKRIETEKRRHSKKEPKPKQKPPPLSKYRRKAANCRERTRMQDMNEAFDKLQQVVPSLGCEEEEADGKLTKITTLRLAINYINALSTVLQAPPEQEDSSDILDEFGSDLGSLSDFGSAGSAIDSPPAGDFTNEMDVNMVSDLLFNEPGFQAFLESDGESLFFSDQSTP